MFFTFNQVVTLFQQVIEEPLVYSVPDFTKKKVGRNPRSGEKSVDGQSIYADVRVLGYE